VKKRRPEGDSPVFHHRISLELLLRAGNELKPSEHFTKLKPEEDDALIVNRWLEKQVGFYPLFLAVGTQRDDILQTAYHVQWHRCGEPLNYVLLSFRDVPDPVFVDEQAWFCVLNSSHCDYRIGPGIRKTLLKRSWTRSRWMRWSKKRSAYAVVRSLNPKDADRVWVRNRTTGDLLLKEGYRNVSVHRMRVGD
jgi:hypothetical protein